ncbi:hypothetical protein [Aeromonas simiae]|uniref:hypothetical protein n=1 Tax=Aeromonas simiae TaxID=218936 RepID=UPI00266B9491|nr:hypothetical protein [Aeromonas simiae]MDO2950591.1 hypothetical protein [Aeromonas simiae]
MSEQQRITDLLRDLHGYIGSSIPQTISEHYRGCDLLDRIDAVLAGELSSLPDCTEVTRTAPERIWLQVSDNHGDHNEPFPTGDELGFSEITWCADSQGGTQVEYLRADLSHWITRPARIGGVVFQRGIKVETVIEAAYRAAEQYKPDPDKFNTLLSAIAGEQERSVITRRLDVLLDLLREARNPLITAVDASSEDESTAIEELIELIDAELEREDLPRKPKATVLTLAPKQQGGEDSATLDCDLVAEMEAILLMLRKEPNTNAALMKAEERLHQAIVMAKTGGNAACAIESPSSSPD